jgi:hypothetical protein
MCITGDNFISNHWTPDTSYFFSRYALIWGWATWRRAWQHYRVDAFERPEVDWSRILWQKAIFRKSVVRHWNRLLGRVRDGTIDTWDYQWSFAIWKLGGLVCVPRVNMVANIGFDQNGTHTIASDLQRADIAARSMEFPIVHPDRMEVEEGADRWLEDNIYFPGIIKRLRGRLGRNSPK